MDAPNNAVAELYGYFGGLRKMLRAIGEDSPALIQNWEKTGRIPHYRRSQIKEAIETKSVAVPPDLLDRVCPAKDMA